MDLEQREHITMLFEKYQKFLSQGQKQALHLTLIEDLSLREIADIQATSRQAVHDAIKKGIEKLKEIEQKI